MTFRLQALVTVPAHHDFLSVPVRPLTSAVRPELHSKFAERSWIRLKGWMKCSPKSEVDPQVLITEPLNVILTHP